MANRIPSRYADPMRTRETRPPVAKEARETRVRIGIRYALNAVHGNRARIAETFRRMGWGQDG